MKLRLLILSFIVGLVACSQPTTGYTNINVGYNSVRSYFRAIHIPAYGTTPSLQTGQWTGSGAIGIDSVLHRQYFYSGGFWRRIFSTLDTTSTLATQYYVSTAISSGLTLSAIGSSPNANGATLSAGTLNLQPANGSFGGVVTTSAQTFAGAKTFTGNVLMSGSRFETYKGADVAAANDLTLGGDGNLFTITGNTQINAITTTNWQAGSKIALLFTGSPTVKNNTAGGGSTAPILLAGRQDFTAASGDYISLQYDGSNWYETGRKMAGKGSSNTFTNGLTETGNTVRLGGTLTGSTSIAAGANLLTISTATAASQPVQITSTTGTALGVTSTTGVGISVSSTGANASGVFNKHASSTTGIGVPFHTTRTTSGTAANDIASALDAYIQNASGSLPTGRRFITTLTNATAGSETSKEEIQLQNAGSLATKLTIHGLGYLKLAGITATAASALTAEDGMIVYVTNTDATFTSIGFWARENGVWVKM